MPTHLEIEYKTLLSMSEFERLSTLFSHVKPVVQTNFYFDTKDLRLRENRLALRIRCFSHQAEMTLKVPQAVGNMEYNIELSLDAAKELIAAKSLKNSAADLSEISQFLIEQGISLEGLTCLGSLKTTRREYAMPIGLAALDSNEYLDSSDYELELEVEDSELGQKDFDDFLKKNDIEFRYARSKVVRFLDVLKHKNKH